ncbi:MAG: single-stranded-DNA-specific exonuclease RecJ, partial [Desulfuromonas sp.]
MEPVNRRRWQERPPLLNPVEEQKLASVLNLRPLTVSVLVRRGIDREANARQFLDGGLNTLPDPFLLKGMEAATTRLQQAIGKGETILVHGDYDVDGISGSALLVEGIKKLGGTVDYHIPLRLRDGYGLSAEALQQAAQGGIRVVLSVDCGISACDEAELARRLGIDLIITDHHQPPEQLPEATAIINPHQPGCEFPFKALAGVGVAFFLLVALRKRLRETGYFSQRPEPDLRHSLDLVALGTIADIVPLHGVNRLL